MHYSSLAKQAAAPVVLKEKGSQFLAYGFRCESIAGFEEQLQMLKKEHHTASHHCYAWRMFPGALEEFAQDDGEPSGTAGLPILNQMKSAHLCNSAVVVVRYFGGTKLGKRGLISAYGDAAAGCIKAGPVQQLQPGRAVDVRFDYPYKRKIDDTIALYEGITAAETFTEAVAYTVHLPVRLVEKAVEAFKEMEYLGVEVQEKASVLIYS